MSYTGHCGRLLTAKIAFGRLPNKYTSLSYHHHSKTVMERAASSLPYHVHKVRVNQESVQIKGRTIDFEMSVIDTHPGFSGKLTVIGLHGIPGSATVFEPCIQRLLEKNVRFIAPMFSGSETSNIESWKLYHLNYSSTGFASLVLQIMDHFGIDRASMVMCHSGGAWVGYNMAAQSDRVKSLCLLSPGGGRPNRTLRPPFFMDFVAWLMRIEHLHFLLMSLLGYAYHLMGFSDVKGGDHLMAAQQIYTSQNYNETRQHATQVQKKRIPLLFAYALNDKIVGSSIHEEMLFQHLKVPKTKVTRVDSQRNQIPLCDAPVDPESSLRWFVHGLQFERGGHVVHKAYYQIIMDHIMQLLQLVKNDDHLQG